MRLATLVLCATLGAFGALGAGAVGAQGRPPRPSSQAERDSLETRVQERMGQMLRTQLGLSADQMRQLQVTNRTFEGQRRALFDQERQVRMELRGVMTQGDSADPARITALLDRVLVLQRQRLDLLEAEQRELATFLSPMQRARLFGMAEQIRRQMMEMRQQGPPARRPMDGAAPPTAPRRPR